MTKKGADNLTLKQERFAQKYVELGNASEAYRQSYDAAAMKPETINRNAKAMVENSKIATRIEELRGLALKRHQVTVDRVIAEYAKIAFLDIRKAFGDDGDLKPIHEIDDDTAAAIAGVESEAVFEGSGRDRERVGTLKKIKLADKKGALDSIAKHLGMFTDKTEITGKDGGPVDLTDARAALLRGIVPEAPGG